MLPGETLYTPDQAAAILNMSVKTLNGHARRGEIRFIKIGGTIRTTRRFTQKHLDQFMKDRTVKRAAAVAASSTKIKSTTKSKSEPEPTGFWEHV